MKKVSLTQFVHPNGTQKKVHQEVSDEAYAMAQRQVLTCECMPHDYTKVILYSYPKGEDPEEPGVEECLFANNGPGENNPAYVLEKLIQLVDAKIKKKEESCQRG